MGTREVYEEKMRRGNLYHDPTIKPGLGSPRCPRCLSLLNPIKEKSEWEISPVLHDVTSVVYDHDQMFGYFDILGGSVLQVVVCGLFLDWFWVGSGIGGLISAVHGFNTGIPYFQNRVSGPKWLPFVIGIPPLLMFSAASASFGGYVLPKFSQLTVTSYYAASSASHYGISLFTRHIEDNHLSRIQQKQLP